ncbi:winged helix-turn-helix transcriptional regulator [Actinoplanes sp. CA-142083]|uniref:winged helix-turn-helix transcriptional regulator n=1 Tax=Actinoplanes sp. CA-142083 TaxID=3239903 RepID=UPI003D8A095F
MRAPLAYAANWLPLAEPTTRWPLVGLVSRTVYPVVPPRVDYELTPLGKDLLDTSWTLLNWALDHVGEIDKAREAYDEARVSCS